MSVQLEDEEAGRLGFGLIAHIPREQAISLQTTLPILRSENLCVEMCNLTYLQLDGVDLSTFFPEPGILGPHTSEDALRSLDHIVITRPDLNGGGWSPLTNFLSRRAAVGNRVSSLRLRDHQNMDKAVVKSIRCAVKVFEAGSSYDYEDSNEDEGSDGVEYL